MKRVLLIWGLVVLALVILLLFIGLIFRYALKNPPYNEISQGRQPGFSLALSSHGNPPEGMHSFIDKAVFYLGKISNKDKLYFRDGVESVPLEEHLKAIRLSLPGRLDEGLHEIGIGTLEGEMDPAVLVLHWAGADAPTVIYNHGASQIPFDGIFRGIFDEAFLETNPFINLIAVRAPFHRESREELNEGASTLSRYLAILAVTVRLDEMLIQHFRSLGSPQVVLAGISMGGYTINLHGLHYNSADAYVPILAGTAFDDVFLNRSPAHPSALEKGYAITGHLNFTDQWLEEERSNVYPVLGRFDQISLPSVQGPSYGKVPVDLWKSGHITTALSFRALRKAILASSTP